VIGERGPMSPILRVNRPGLVAFYPETKSNGGTFRRRGLQRHHDVLVGIEFAVERHHPADSAQRSSFSAPPPCTSDIHRTAVRATHCLPADVESVTKRGPRLG
jgi:hypothetical protein